jgi:hypothetical protein
MSRFVTDTLDGIEITRAKDVKKHGTHDQKTHGSWANLVVGDDLKTIEGKTITSLIDKLSEKRTPGFTIDLRTKTSPKDGFMASDSGAERTLDFEPLKASRASLRTAIKDYVLDHAELLDNKGSFFGAWVDQGKLYLDVSRRYSSRSEGVRAGFKNDQKAIYDVVNDSYIYMEDEVDERTNKARVSGDSQASSGDERRGDGRLRGRNPSSDRGQSVKFPHVCLGRYTVQKHREGEHDQSTHGNWAGDRYPEDSVKGARDGAKEYAFKKGLKPDDTIDYTKVVANRERASKIADIYETLPKMDRDAVDEYEALASEVEEQFDYMTKTLGVKVEFVADDPYKTSKEMFADVSTGNLKVLATASTGAHPLFSDLQNDKFRAVHDYFGHAATGRGFGQDGEEAAWVHHSQMFTENARAALTTETRGQNSFFNNRGKQFADQKVALLPAEFWQVPATFQKIKIIRFQAGLKPVFKHQEHDQSTHGKWARGVSAEDEALIEQMSTRGPSKEDIENALLDAEQPDMSDLEMMVSNDSGLYSQATDGIDERAAERLQNLQEEFPNREYSEQEKATIYEDVQNEMVQEFIENDDGSLGQMWMEENGGSFNPEDLHGAFDEVYGISHEVTNNAGEVTTVLGSSTTNIYRDGERLVVQGQVVDSDGNFAGEFQRSFYKETNDNGNEILVVEHDLLRMADEYQGSGFGKNFLAQQEAYYVSKELDAINVGTAWDGARHWARAGFDFNSKYLDQNISEIANKVARESESYGADTAIGKEFDALMSKAAFDYTRDSEGRPTWARVKSMKEDNFPIPNDFAMIGYKDRVQAGTNELGKPIYTWAGKELLDGMNLKYRKVLTQEGRTLTQGPIDRDGDGFVFDGTPREKPVSAVN